MNVARVLMTCCWGAWCLGLDIGCSSCQAPYDYSGPTVGPDGKPIGGFGTRVGSVWAGTTPAAPRPTAPTVASRTQAEAAPAGQAPPAGAPDAGAPNAITPGESSPLTSEAGQPASPAGER